MADLDSNIQVMESLVDDAAELVAGHMTEGRFADAHAAIDVLAHLNNVTAYAVMNRNDVEVFPQGMKFFTKVILPHQHTLNMLHTAEANVATTWTNDPDVG